MNVNKIVEECNPFELPSIPLSQKPKLTASAGIYFVLHKNQILYIGKSDCIKSRWINHGQLKRLREIDGIVRISCIEYPVKTIIDRIAIELMEQAFIDKFKPCLNKKKSIRNPELDIDKYLADCRLRFQQVELLGKPNPIYNPLSKQATRDNLGFQWNSGGNMEAQLDRISLNSLMGRYSIRKSALYDRLNALKIKSEKTRNGSYINAEQLKVLDELNDFLKKGGKIAEFISRQIDCFKILI